LIVVVGVGSSTLVARHCWLVFPPYLWSGEAMDTASNACWGYAAVHWLIVFLGGGFLECTVSTILTLMIVAFCNRTLS